MLAPASLHTRQGHIKQQGPKSASGSMSGKSAGSALCRFEGNRCLCFELGAGCLGLKENQLSRAILKVCPALLAMFGRVLESHDVEEQLLPRRKHELRTAVVALQFSVSEIQSSPNRPDTSPMFGDGEVSLHSFWGNVNRLR